MQTTSPPGPPAEAKPSGETEGLAKNRDSAELRGKQTSPQRACQDAAPPKTIPLLFTKPGFRYRLIERIADVAIYEQRFISGGLAAYEVVRIRVREERRIGNSVIEAGEYLPSSEEWGRHGWTYSDFCAFEHAKDRLAVLTNEQAKERGT